MKYILPALAILIFLFSPAAFAQELVFDVTVNMQQVPAANKEYLSNFANDVKQYLNDYRWTTDDYMGEKIHCTMSIFFLNGTPDNIYTVQVFIGSQRPVYKSNKGTLVLRILDANWEFTYVRGQALYHNEFQFDPLMSFLDFYAYLILGFDGDTYAEMGGTPYFQKASEIVSRAVQSSSNKGWPKSGTTYSRQQVVEDLLNTRFTPLRKADFIYHFHGLDLMSTNPNRALENMLYAINLIGKTQKAENTTIALARIFFEAKYQEISDLFLQYPDKSVIGKFADYDPAHRQTYEDAMRK